MGKSGTACRCWGYDNRSCIFGIHAAVFLKLAAARLLALIFRVINSIKKSLPCGGDFYYAK